MKDDKKHWYVEGEKVNAFKKVWVACGKMVHFERDCSLEEPTCLECMLAKNRDTALRETI